MRTTSPLLLTALLALPLAAQDGANPFRFVPADAQLVVRIPSPARCRKEFAGTSLEKLWSSSLGKDVLAKMSAQVDERLAEAREKDPRIAEFLQSILDDWTGEVVLGLRIDLAALALAPNGEVPPMAMSVSMTPDGKVDFATHAAALAELAEEESPEQKLDLQAGGHTFRSVVEEGAPGVTFPQVIDGYLVIFASTDLEKDLSGLVAAESRFEPRSGAAAAPLAVHVAAESFADGLRSALAPVMESAPFDVDKLLTAFGLDALAGMDLVVGREGEHVELGFAVSLRDGPRGIFDVLVAEPVDPRLLHLVPADVEAFSVGSFPVAKLVDWFGTIFDEMAPAIGMDWKDAQDAFAEEAKVRLVEDLVAHLGTGVLTLQNLQEQVDALAEEEDAEDMSSVLAGSCFALQLRDGKAFGASLEKMLRARGLHAARKTEEYQGAKIYRLNIAGLLELEYVVTDDLLLLASGKAESSRRSLRSVLDLKAKPMDGELPAALAARVSQFQEGWTGFGVFALADFCEVIAKTTEKAPAAQTGRWRSATVPPLAIASGMREFAAELRRLGLDVVPSATYVSKNRIEARYRW